MIYLIGGPPRSGKSTLAHKLSRKLRCPEISVDWLRSVVLPYLNDQDKVAIENILFQGEDGKATHTDVDEAAVLWPAVKSFVEDKARWQGDFVIDGIHLLPKYLHTINEDKKPNVRIIFVVKADEEKILSGFDEVRIRKNDWLLKKNWNDKEYLKRTAQDIAARGQYFTSEAQKYHFTVINTEDNFEEKINTLTERLYQERKELKKKK